MHPGRDRPAARAVVFALVFAAALGLATVGAEDRVQSWHDASRLATIESLVDHGGFAIDDSPFARMTSDKVLIDGHYYSHQPPVLAVLGAGAYRVLKTATGLDATRTRPAFVRWMTVCTSGLAYALAVVGILAIARLEGLPWAPAALVTASFGLSSLAVVYLRALNSHMVLLGVAVWTLLLLSWAERARGPARLARLGLAGFSAGLGATLDQGTGTLLLAAAGAMAFFSRRDLRELILFGVAALPWLLLSQAINHAISGSWVPIAMHPEYFRWPGSPWAEGALTGGFKSRPLSGHLRYAVELAFVGRGFVRFDPTLWLALVGGIGVLGREGRLLAVWALATWGLYTLGSTNLSGVSVSVRWFLPLLAAGYFVLARALAQRRWLWPQLVWLSLCGGVGCAALWPGGPLESGRDATAEAAFSAALPGALVLAAVQGAAWWWRRRAADADAVPAAESGPGEPGPPAD